MLTRNLTAKIILDGQDVTRDLSPFLRSLTYEDNLSGEADTLTVELMDKQYFFMGEYFPPRGATVNVELVRNNFRGDYETERLPLGTFEIDEITNSYAPSICKIKAVSISQNNYLRQHAYSKSWENVKLSEIAAEIAQAAGVQLFFQSDYDPTITRAEQGEESTLAFLEKICTDNGLALKVSDNQLIIFEEEILERQSAVTVFDRNSSTITRFSATATLNEIYGSAEVSYRHGKHAEKYQAKFDAPDKTSRKVLKINQRVDSQAEAERLAKKKLREKNKDELKINIDCVGDFALVAGSCIELRNHGFYNGKYIIEKATHAADTNGYTVRLDVRKCLNGY